MQIEMGTKLKFQHEREPRTVANILLNYDYDSVTIVFDDGEMVGNPQMQNLLDTGKVEEVFA